MKHISIIIPAYNEEKLIGDSIDRVYRALEKTNKNFEIIIIDDGSIDSTSKIIKDRVKNYPELRYIHNPVNKGRGYSLKKAFEKANGQYLFYVDADLSICFNLFHRLLQELEGGADIAIGSKHLPSSSVEYKVIRKQLSKIYHFLVNLLFKTDIRDFQCGFKGFRKEIIQPLIKVVKSDGWFWDTEILIKSKLKGFNIIEVPARVINVPGRGSKVNVLRDSFVMGMSLLKLWIECLFTSLKKISLF